MLGAAVLAQAKGTRRDRERERNEERVEVTEENFGDFLIQGLEEVQTIQRGEIEPVRRVKRAMNVREDRRE